MTNSPERKKGLKIHLMADAKNKYSKNYDCPQSGARTIQDFNDLLIVLSKGNFVR